MQKDIQDFKRQHGCERVVVIWAASTEIYVPYDEAYHKTLAQLEVAMKSDDREHVAPSMCYAYAALTEAVRLSWVLLIRRLTYLLCGS